jgi:hypothetical protein
MPASTSAGSLSSARLAGARWPARPRLLDLVAGVLVALALLTAVVGPWHLDLAGIPVSASRPSRLLLEALALLLVASCLWPARHQALVPVALAALCLCASAESRPRRVGDGHEYAAMALNLARLGPPALTRAEAREWEARLHDWGADDSLADADLEAAGRFDQPHFWAYSLAAAPFVAAAGSTGLPWTLGFVALNALLLVGAVLALQRAGASPATVLLLAGSPILWWVDKVHAEVLIFFLLTLAVCAWPRAPGASVLALGALSAQNPAGLAPLVGALLLGGRTILGPGRQRTAAAGGVALALVPLVYSSARIGRPLPLANAVFSHVPGPAAIFAPLLDPNVGLLWAFPALGAVALRAAVSPARPARSERGLFAGLAAALLLLTFAQTTNVNHGGTPGPSRYGLWLIPLALPLALEAERGLAGRQRRAWAALCAASFVFSLVTFAPRRPESYLTPSPVAAWLWREVPGLDSPLPEVFAERVTGRDGAVRLPAATADCHKVLTVGPAAGSWWPLRCRPPDAWPPPPLARLLYANQAAAALRWSPAPAQPAFHPERTDEAAWMPPLDDASRTLLGAVEWDSLRERAAATRGSFVSSRRRTGRIVAYQGPTALVVWMRRPREGATLRADLGGASIGAVFDASSGRAVAWLAGAGAVAVPVPAGRACVVVLRRP